MALKIFCRALSRIDSCDLNQVKNTIFLVVSKKLLMSYFMTNLLQNFLFTET